MFRSCRIPAVVLIGVTAVLLVAGPTAAQESGVSVTPAVELEDGAEVRIVASATAGTFGTLGLCPAASLPPITATHELSRLQSDCVGLLCLYSGDLQAYEPFATPDCPVVDNGEELVSSVDLTVSLPRFARNGDDCAEVDCVVTFATWSGPLSVVESVSAPVTFLSEGVDTTEPSAPVVGLPEVAESAETAQIATTLPPTTTVLLAPPVTTIQIPAPAVTTTLPTQVLAEQESNELAVTGLDVGVLLGVALGLLLAGGGLGYLGRRDDRSN